MSKTAPKRARKSQGQKKNTHALKRHKKPEVERWAELFHFNLPKQQKKDKKSGGRPQTVTDQIVRKLELAFAYDCTVEEACILAGLPRSTYYDFLKETPAFSDNIELLRTIPFLVARKVILSGIESDPNLALKYLERKLKKEFSLKLELGHSGAVQTTHDLAPDVKDAIDNVFVLFEKKARAVGDDLTAVYADDEKPSGDES